MAAYFPNWLRRVTKSSCGPSRPASLMHDSAPSPSAPSMGSRPNPRDLATTPKSPPHFVSVGPLKRTFHRPYSSWQCLGSRALPLKWPRACLPVLLGKTACMAASVAPGAVLACHVIRVSERDQPVGLSAPPDLDRRCWFIDVYFDGDPVKIGFCILDPFTQAEHDQCREYWDNYLSHKQFPLAQANERSIAINSYRTRLYAQLEKVLSTLRFTRLAVKIDVEELPGAAGPTHTIHCLHWEHLEELSLWPESANLKSVTIRRTIGSPSNAQTDADGTSPTVGIERKLTWTLRDRPPNTIGILLVIARKLHDEERDVRPSQAQNAILQAKKLLQESNSPYDIRLEVVRPGTYLAFQQHLGDVHKRFHLVHFDVHGEIKHDERGRPLAMLNFADPNSELLEPVEARYVAQFLIKRGVTCAVVNACDSGSPTAGVDANLSRVFAKAGIRNVVAMSYKFSTSAAYLFHATFYESLLIDRKSFSDATSLARRTLRREPRRVGQANQRFEMQDWIIPVFYAHNGAKEVQIVPSTVLPWPPLATLKVFVSMVFWLTGMLTLILKRRIEAFWKVTLSADHTYKMMESGRDEQTLPRFKSQKTEYVEVDVDVLRLEEALVDYRLVYFRGGQRSGKTRFVTSLCKYWQSTHFVDGVHIVDACRFLERPPLWKRVLPRLIHRDILHGIRFSWPGHESERRPPTRIVIVDHIDKLYTAEDEALVQARARLERFLLQVAGRASLRDPPNNYVIIIGRQEDGDWWSTNFRRHPSKMLDGPLLRRREKELRFESL